MFGTKNKTEQKKLTRQIKFSVIPLVVAGILIGIHHLIPQKSFSPNTAGILVLRIAGDDDGSLQRELVNSLNNKLAVDTNGQPIEVWADDNSADEGQGLPEAHNQARRIGEKEMRL